MMKYVPTFFEQLSLPFSFSSFFDSFSFDSRLKFFSFLSSKTWTLTQVKDSSFREKKEETATSSCLRRDEGEKNDFSLLSFSYLLLLFWFSRLKGRKPWPAKKFNLLKKLTTKKSCWRLLSSLLSPSLLFLRNCFFYFFENLSWKRDRKKLREITINLYGFESCYCQQFRVHENLEILVTESKTGE